MQRERGGRQERQGNCTPCFAAAKTFFSQRHCACIMHAHAEEEEQGVDSAADSLRGENSKSFAVTIFLTVLPVIFVLDDGRARTRASGKTVSCKNVRINEMILFLSRALFYRLRYANFLRDFLPVLPLSYESGDACKKCTERAVINDECLDAILGTLRIDAFNVMSANGRHVPII